MPAREPRGDLRRDHARTWALLGQKPGDNGQVLALAEALGWPFETRRMAYRPIELLTNRLLGVTLLGIDPADPTSWCRPGPSWSSRPAGATSPWPAGSSARPAVRAVASWSMSAGPGRRWKLST